MRCAAGVFIEDYSPEIENLNVYALWHDHRARFRAGLRFTSLELIQRLQEVHDESAEYEEERFMDLFEDGVRRLALDVGLKHQAQKSPD